MVLISSIIDESQISLNQRKHLEFSIFNRLVFLLRVQLLCFRHFGSASSRQLEVTVGREPHRLSVRMLCVILPSNLTNRALHGMLISSICRNPPQLWPFRYAVETSPFGREGFVEQHLIILSELLDHAD